MYVYMYIYVYIGYIYVYICIYRLEPTVFINYIFTRRNDVK